MSEIVLNGKTRTATKTNARQVRRAGNVPGIYYLHGEVNIPIEVQPLSLKPLVFTSETHVIDLRLEDGGSKKCILRDVQFDPVSDMPIHFDLQGLKEDEELTIDVPVVLTGGIPQGVRDGGMLQHIVHRLRIVCLPKHIPEKVEINVGELGINSFIHVRDLNIPNVTILDSPENSVLGVLPPTVEKTVEPAAEVAPAPTEPELVAKGKKPEEGAEGPEKAKAPEKKPA